MCGYLSLQGSLSGISQTRGTGFTLGHLDTRLSSAAGCLTVRIGVDIKEVCCGGRCMSLGHQRHVVL